MKKTPFVISLREIIIGTCLCAFGLGVRADETNVTVENFDFNPASVSINVNDSVKWTWTSGTHTVTEDQLLWDSDTQSAPSGTFTVVFTNSGVFPYTCTFHGQMHGSVTVTGGNQPPSVSITNPPGGSTFAEPWSGVLQATAADDGSVTNVEFFRDSTSLGSVSTPPYNMSVNNLAAGTYTFTAVASDELGATTTSSGVGISVVTPVAIALSAPQRLSATQFRFSYTANPGLTYVVERSATVSGFVGIDTNAAGSSSVTFTDGNASGGVNFYRVRRLPNP